jgi:hypothetical protein
MVKIPEREDPLIKMIDAVIEAQPQEERAYLGASQIGHDCSRYLWYKYNGHKEKFDAKTLRRFADGHRTEAVVLDWLRDCEGIEIYTRGNEGNQIGFNSFNGAFAGHYDGIGRGFPQAPATWHIVEVKCVGEKPFEELCKLKAQDEKTAIVRWKPEYFSQVQVYMHAEELTRAIHIVATPGARDLISVRTEYDRAHAEAMFAKAKRITDATEPPERIGDATFYKCRMCPLKDVCHGT